MLHYGQNDQQIPTEETSSAQMTAFSNLSEPGKEDVPPQEDNDVELKFKVLSDVSGDMGKNWKIL